MILRCFDNGMTPVSILGTLVKAIVAFEINGKSGQVKILNLIFPDTAVSSALTSRGALTAVWNRIAKPGGVALGLRLVTRDATGWAWKLKAASPNYSRISILLYLIRYMQLTMLSSGWPGNGGNTRILHRWKWLELRFQKMHVWREYDLHLDTWCLNTNIKIRDFHILLYKANYQYMRTAVILTRTIKLGETLSNVSSKRSSTIVNMSGSTLRQIFSSM